MLVVAVAVHENVLPSFNVMTGTTFHVKLAVPAPETVAVASLLVLLDVMVPPIAVQ